MCGIAGKVCLANSGEEIPLSLIERMVETLRHRGPDDSGVYLSPDTKAGIGMSRLSIIDLHTGHQPMSSPDGAVNVVLNGEIYNYREIRRRFAGRYDFRTTSDAEVLLPLYEEFGLAMVDHLHGMFAFAVWDQRRRRLVVARDRVGQKPLYFAHDPAARTFVFGSEIKAILTDASVCRETDPIAMDEYLTYGFVPAPRSIYRAIAKLPPGHCGVFDADGWRVQQYWRVDYSSPQPIDEGAAIEQFDELMTQAVEARLVSDVPLGSFLSGGMDSAVITAIMCKLACEPVRSFSIGFHEADFNELDDARRTAQHCGTEHTEKIVDWNIQDMVPLLARHFDEPFADSSAVPTYHVSRMARENITVALSGDGGDELLAGYNRYQAQKFAEAFNRIPRLLRHPLERLLLALPTPASYFGGSLIKTGQHFLEYARGLGDRGWQSWLRYFDDDLRAKLYRPGAREALADEQNSARGSQSRIERIAQQAQRFDSIHQIMWIDLMTYLPDDILVKVDRMSMAVSLEARSPFLDHRLIEWLATLPISLKLRGMTRKFLLRRLADRYFPKGMFNRPKQGFAIPLSVWFQDELGDWLIRRLSGNAKFSEMFELSVVTALLDQHRRGRGDHSHRLWALLMLGEFLGGA